MTESIDEPAEMSPLMNAHQLTFPTCVIPGCALIVPNWGQPCEDCLTAFGPFLAPSKSEALTREQIQARDQAVRDVIRQRQVLVVAEPERKSMQVCWLCEGRHTCTRVDGRWECDTCTERGE